MEDLRKKAKKIIKDAVSAAIDDIWETPPDSDIFYGRVVYPNRCNLDLLEEHSIYEIKSLGLEKEEEQKYIREVIDAFGEYSSDKPFQNRENVFYDPFYFNKNAN